MAIIPETIPHAGVTTEGKAPTAASLIKGAREAIAKLRPLKKQVSAVELEELKTNGSTNETTRQELARQIEEAGKGEA